MVFFELEKKRKQAVDAETFQVVLEIHELILDWSLDIPVGTTS